MAQTVRRAIEGRYPSCYIPSRIKERRAKARALRLEQQRKPDKPEDFVCYSDSDSEEETPTQQHQTLCTSYNFVDYVRSREIQAPEPRSVDQSYATRHMLTHDMFRETPVNLGNMNKVFCSQWLSDRQVVFGTKCNKLMVYDVRTRSLDAIPTLRPRAPWPGLDHQTGIHALQINPSRTLLATGARNSCELAIYSLPTLDPVCVGEAHKDWILDMCWLDDEFLVTGSRDSKLALWRAPSAPPSAAPTASGAAPAPHHDYVAPLALRDCRAGELTDHSMREGLCPSSGDINRLMMKLCAGLLMFYDLRAGKYLESNIHSSKTVTLRASRGYVYPQFPDEDADGFNQVKYVPAIYTHCYDHSGTRIFTAGGPLPAPLVGNYAGIWQ
ncbi:hypothetical protein evm_010045 [Chilo suppressalis]|nr:hypothetical protein evm_010045 [Chilo suppressalis]